MQRIILSGVAVLALLSSNVQAQVPPMINYQGRVVVGTTNFNGTGQFKFALVNSNGATTYWSNDGTSSAGSQPTNAVSLAVSKGLYSVLLGDTSVANMTSPIAASVFSNSDVRLRVWFNDGTANGWQLLTPDQRIASVAYAMQSGSSGSTGPWLLNGTSAYYNSGNVGIGTSTPAAALDLFSSDTSRYLLKLKSPGGNQLFEATSTRPTIALRDQNSNFANPLYSVMGGWDGGFRFYTDSFWQGGNGLAMMALDNNGHLGIGTSAPASALHVSGAADALRLTGPQPYLTLDNTTAGFISRIQANGGGMDLKTNGAAINGHPGIIHLDQLGIVGLGTTTPKHQLSIRSFAGGPTWTSNGWIGAIDLDNASAIAWGSNSAGQRFGMGHSNGSFVMWRTAADPGTVANPAVYDFTITDAGNVGINTLAPAGKLQVVSGGDINTPQALVTQTTSGDYARLRFTASGSPTAWDIAAGASGGTMNFYATSTGRNVMSLNTNGTASVQILSITGGADLAEPFPMQDEEIEKGAVVVIDETNPGHLKRSTRAYDRRVAGIVSGANGVKPGISLQQEGVLEGGQNVALTGRVYVQADASNGAIEPGDMLTTSDIPGYAMKVGDHAKAQGAIIGKAMGSLKKDKGMVLVLVSLQ